MRFAALAALSFIALAVPSSAQQTPASPAKPPRLLVVISVDQFSADLFSEYRARFTGGLARLQQGGVFPSGYQSHSATETCPGHSTILTGDHPARTGIVANDWIDLNAARADKTVYCAEDESVAGSTSSDYTVSDKHLLVPTLGERMKAANPATRVVSVAGKDRAAVMMGGHKVDELWWWDGKRFRSYAGRAEPGAVTRTNRAVTARLAEAQPATPMIDACADRSRAIAVKDGLVMGAGRFARAAGDAKAFRYSPEFDAAVLALSTALIYDMKLGQGPTTDIISIGASATDYIGHGYGTQGSEMCLQLMALDASLGDFMTRLDATGVDYMVVLTADHGGLDMAERSRMEGAPDAQRIAKSFDRDAIAKAANAAAGTPEGSVVFNGSEIYLDGKLTGAQRAKLTGLLVAAIARQPQVADVFTRAQIEAAPVPAGPPESWSIIDRVKANHYAPRSGDLYVVLKPRVTPIADPGPGYVATHGSVWDYDRRVPMLFWRKGMAGFEQPLGVETVDIAPTLASVIGLTLPAGAVDGRCLDLDPGATTTCR
ncbi:alkaline phosphatase family protein [Sphingorhabdus soli]|uniref:Alkaline phosphatase family protein n=1 Tax=Flavisphingopyxis soli TaxID=2601267 RepID=A0A5C6USI8_9SPHN|nr:alkaline phosphatase family protein [Sphingorhabdus soli]TXC73828.1 alkaline phosphatase family protein [Sphingorhabdus soli]